MSERKDALLSTKKQLQFQLNCFETSTNEESPDVAAVQARVANSDKILPQFIKIALELKGIDENLCTNDELIAFERQFYKTISKAKTICGTPNTDTPSTSQKPASTSINLKKPELQKFSGENYEDWPAFHQMFNSLVHSNTTVPNIMKFHYLKGAVIGKAAELIKTIEFTEQNYSVALQSLIDRYENKKKFVQRHMQILFQLGDILQSEKGVKLTAKHLEKIYNQVNQTLRALEAADIDTASWDPFLAHAITSKFDESTLAEWEDVAPPKDVPTRKELLDFLIKRQRVLESLETKSPKSQNVSQIPSRSLNSPQKRKQTTFGLWEKEQNPKIPKFNGKKFFKKCTYCNSVNHPINECTNFKKLTLPDRALIVKSNKLCYQCLKGHQGVCKNLPCSICSGKHHQLLHQNKTNVPQVEPEIPNQI